VHNPYEFSGTSTSTPLGARRVSHELKKVVRYLTSLVDHFSGPFEAKRLGFCLVGLTGLPNDLIETSDLIDAIVKKVIFVRIQ
jgi:hypothetical protein